MSEEYNLKGYHPPVATNADACLECHLCEMLCPEFAIYITLRDEQEAGSLVENKR
jgi:2-oxoglutarate ferredoxin oxidoreductase subunit delta